MSASITPRQNREIHAILTATNLDDGSYRGMLAQYDVTTSKDLSEADAGRLLARMRQIPGAQRYGTGRAADTAEGRFARQLQAMWIALYNLGEVTNGRDAALHAFIERQTGLSHSRFLQSAEHHRAVVEALKDMLRRAGAFAPGLSVTAMKRLLLRVQWRRCMDLGAVPAPADPAARYAFAESGLAGFAAEALGRGARRALDDMHLTGAELDIVARVLGKMLRRAMSEQAEARHAG